MLPFPAWQQWVVKTIVVVGLSLGLAFALPVLLARGGLAFSPIHAGAAGVAVLAWWFGFVNHRTAR